MRGVPVWEAIRRVCVITCVRIYVCTWLSIYEGDKATKKTFHRATRSKHYATLWNLGPQSTTEESQSNIVTLINTVALDQRKPTIQSAIIREKLIREKTIRDHQRETIREKSSAKICQIHVICVLFFYYLCYPSVSLGMGLSGSNTHWL